MIWPWHLDLKTSFKVPKYSLIKDTMYSISQIGAKEEKMKLQTRIFHFILLGPSHLTLKVGSRSQHTPYSKAVYVRYEPCTEKRYDLDHWPTNFIQGHWYPLTIDTLWVKYELDWAKRRKDMLRICDLGRTDRRTVRKTDGMDALITIGHPQSKALIMTTTTLNSANILISKWYSLIFFPQYPFL